MNVKLLYTLVSEKVVGEKGEKGDTQLLGIEPGIRSPGSQQSSCIISCKSSLYLHENRDGQVMLRLRPIRASKICDVAP